MKKPVTQSIGCLDCFFAKLIQWDDDPVIAECHHGRFVARYGRRKCETKEITNKQKPIERRKKFWV